MQYFSYLAKSRHVRVSSVEFESHRRFRSSLEWDEFAREQAQQEEGAIEEPWRDLIKRVMPFFVVFYFYNPKKYISQMIFGGL